MKKNNIKSSYQIMKKKIIECDNDPNKFINWLKIFYYNNKNIVHSENYWSCSDHLYSKNIICQQSIIMLSDFAKLAKIKTIRNKCNQNYLTLIAIFILDNNKYYKNELIGISSIIQNIKLPYLSAKNYINAGHFYACMNFQNYTFKECISCLENCRKLSYNPYNIMLLFNNIISKSRTINKYLSHLPSVLIYMIIDYLYYCN